MADTTKYGKYFFDGFPGGPEHRGPRKVLDNDMMEGSHFYAVVMVNPNAKRKKPINTEMSGHPPHIHKYAEILFHIGLDPDNPDDLGAEVEIYMGKELERFVFNKSMAIFIPPNFLHCPYRPIKTEKPWLMLEVNQGPKHTEKFYPQLLPRNVREKTDWSFWKDEGGYFSLPLCTKK